MYDLLIECDETEVNGVLPQHGTANSEKKIVVKVRNQISGDEYILLKQSHSIEQVLHWFNLWADKIKNDEPPKWLPETVTLANATEAFYNTAPDDLVDSAWDEVYSYRTRHDLRFAFRGADIPSVLIGRWHGMDTVSTPSNSNLAFQIDLPNFFLRMGLPSHQFTTKGVSIGITNQRGQHRN